MQVGIGRRSAGDIESGAAYPAVDCQASSLGDVSSDQVQALVAEYRVFGRATPADKLRLLTALQEKDHVVLTTGDGTNDAPILATADVGEDERAATKGSLYVCHKSLPVVSGGLDSHGVL